MGAEKTKKPVVVAYIGLGSNIEPRAKYIERALNQMSAHHQIEVATVSTIIETEPVGGPEGEDLMLFLNAVARIMTGLGPIELLDVLQQIERQLGRKRNIIWDSRTIDLDILLYGSQIISSDRLIVPHPLMHERGFVMEPLAEIAPDVLHPILGMTAETILGSIGDDDIEDDQ